MRDALRRHVTPVAVTLTALFAAITGAAHASAALQDEPNAILDLLDRDLEIELALSAMPEHMRDGTAVLALERGGYVPARDGDNGFTCLVRRSGAVPGRFTDSILPICYDAVGSSTLLPAVLDEVRMLEDGESFGQVAVAIEQAWRDGKYEVPGPGVSYMLSPVFCLAGRCGGYVPHTMFYAPYRLAPEVGANDDLFDYIPTLQAAGTPGCMMVIPVGEKERAAIISAGASLIARAQQAMGPTLPRP